MGCYTPPMFSLKALFSEGANKSALRELSRVPPLVLAHEEELKAKSAAELKEEMARARERARAGMPLEELLPLVFALVRETARRELGERHYDVQLMGGAALFRGMIAEMRTGEGKTLVATLPASLSALSEKGVHIVTVNDYLARRDASWMGQVYYALGLSVGVITSDGSYRYDPAHTASAEESAEEVDRERDAEGSFRVFHEFLRPVSRREAYEADITYGTNSEFGFDYLRDHTEYDAARVRQRGHAFAIVDEIDSILIDEARTPLIISAPAAESDSFYRRFADIAAKLSSETDYEIDEKQKSIALTDSGIERAEKLLGIENMYTEKGVRFVHHLETAVRARALFLKDREYVVKDGQVIIVDEFTGRLQHGRRWSDGLHQAIEAKEGVTIERESRTVASITYQNYFRMYEKLAGMTGTAATSSEEFYSVYKLEVASIPTHRTVSRIDHSDLIFLNERGKFKAIAKKVKELHAKGQPVLLGTVSIEKNEELAVYLEKEGVPYEMLNAKNHEREGEIIAQAGAKGRVTLATNMAGRGVDIKLGGIPASTERAEEVRGAGGLFVIGTERHEARRIDNQLRGRAGRQGDPGETQFYISLEDSLMRVFGKQDLVKTLMQKATLSEEEPIQHSWISKSIETAQTRVEGNNFDIRKRVLAFDDVLNIQRKTMYARRREILGADKAALTVYFEKMLAEDAELLARILAALNVEGNDAPLRVACLSAIDSLWLEHLEVMDHLRSSVNLRAYGQRDPLIEYRREGLRLFRELEAALVARTAEAVEARLPSAGAPSSPSTLSASVSPPEEMREVMRAAAQAGALRAPAIAEKKYGRNDMVTITNGTEKKTLKYKRAEEFLKTGAWRII